MIGTKSGMVMQERKQEISCRKKFKLGCNQVFLTVFGDRRMKKLTFGEITFGAEIA